MKSIMKWGFIMVLFMMLSCSTSKNKTKEIVRDGSSFEKAIQAKSISAEYDYVKKVCPDCKLLGQSLVFDKKKPYDVLKFKNAQGDPVSYYFDISSFFGKGF